jgi:hypothetical protein
MAEETPNQVADPWWEVISPEFGEVVPILDDGTGPMEYGCSYVEIQAPTRRAAIVAACKTDEFMGKGWSRGWAARQREDGLCPYTGVKAYPKCDCWDKDTWDGSDISTWPDEDCPKCHGIGWTGHPGGAVRTVENA